MLPRLRPHQCLHIVLLLLAIVATGFWSMDALSELPEEEAWATGTVSSERRHTGTQRAFVLVVDSMPFRMATDPTIMPNLVALQPRSTYGRMESVHDAVTVPALRAAFTGRDHVAVFAFVQNLWHGAGRFDSVFTQAREAGIPAIVHSEGSFLQFEQDLPEQHDTGHELDDQLRAVDEAIEAFRSGSYDLVIAHITFTDTVAHVTGVHSERYREEFAIADDLVGRLDEIVREDENLIVFGDHGHDDLGRHLVGMDVPTFALFRGPGFAPGFEFSGANIRDVRYLMSWALDLPLPASYTGGRYPEALRGADPLPPDFAARATDERVGGSETRLVEFTVVVITLALLVSVWVNRVRSPAHLGTSAWLPALGAWISIGLLIGASGNRTATAAAAVAAAIAAVLPLARSGRTRRDVLWTIGPTAILLFVLWGGVLSYLRPWVGWPRNRDISLVWIVATAIGLALALRVGAMRVAWGLFAVAGLLLYPTILHFGSPAAMVPAWVAMLILVTVENVRLRRASTAGLGNAIGAGPRYVLLIPILLLLLPFGWVFSSFFRFEQWIVPVLRAWLWGRPDADVHPVGLAVALVARLIIFVPWRGGAIAIAAGVIAAIALHFVLLTTTGLAPDEMPRWAFVIGIAACGAAGIASRRLMHPRCRGLSQVAWLTALYLLYVYTIRLDIKFYLWADCLLAALFLSGCYLATDDARTRHPSVYSYLLLLAAAVTAWVTLAWTFHRLEWGFLFDWLPVHIVEDNVGLLAPLFVVPLCIPLVMARLLLSGAFDRWEYPQRTVTLLAGLKSFATLMVAMGIGFREAATDTYLEAVQQTAIWTFVIVALPWRFGDGPRPKTAITGDGESPAV